MKLFDLLDPGQFAQAQADGHLRQQTHPTEPLAVLNYTELCAYSGAWTPVTLACRGLIYNTDTMDIVARPFSKFFNHGQAGAAHIPLDAPVQVTDKMDGSLAVIYQEPSSSALAVATRGSFASEQAIHATAMLRGDRFASFTPEPGWTYLAEIIYPANRILVQYDFDDLVLLGAVHITTGQLAGPADVSGWPGRRTKVFDYPFLGAALAAKPRPNAEGLVVRDLSTGAMTKLKQADYLELHKIVTGLNARVVWQHLVDGKPLADLIAPLPDEFHPWVEQVATTITAQVDQQMAEAEKAYAEIIAQLPAPFERRDFAVKAVQYEQKAALFLLLDARDPRPDMLKHAKPEPGWTPSGRIFTEDNA